MGLLDSVLSSITSGTSPQHNTLATTVLEMLNAQTPGQTQSNSGLGSLVGMLTQCGLGSVVQSWIGTGENAPVHPDQLKAALGPEMLQNLVAKSGLHMDALLPMLSQMLPGIVDKLTPGGQLPTNTAS